MRKHVRIVITAFIGFLVMMCLPICSYATTSHDYKYVYNILSDNCVQITDYLGDVCDLIIPSEIDGYVVTGIASYAFREKEITSVVIPDSVTYIGDYAFYWSRLESVTMPKGNVTLGHNPFWRCDHINQFLIIPNHPSLVYSNATLFSKTDKRIVWVSPLLRVQTYEAPSGIKIIDDYSFAGNSVLTLIIPDSVETIGTNPFYLCLALQEIRVSDDSQRLRSSGDVLFSITENTLIWVSRYKKGNFTVPEGIVTIGYYAFRNSQLQSIILPSSLRCIEADAFADADNLKQLVIPSGVNTIGNYCFVSCSSLSSITIPASVTTIGEKLFGKYGSRYSNFIVESGSYAEEYCKENNLSFTIQNDMSWLNP